MPYHILRADLTTGTSCREEVPAELISRFLGGKGLAAHYLSSELPPGTDPLSPENLLIFMTGPALGHLPRHLPARGGDQVAGHRRLPRHLRRGLLRLGVAQGRPSRASSSPAEAPVLSYLEVTEEGARIVRLLPILPERRSREPTTTPASPTSA